MFSRLRNTEDRTQQVVGRCIREGLGEGGSRALAFPGSQCMSLPPFTKLWTLSSKLKPKEGTGVSQGGEGEMRIA